MKTPQITWLGETVTAADGVLLVGRDRVGLPLADRIARSNGFLCAEQLVAILPKPPRNLEPPVHTIRIHVSRKCVVVDAGKDASGHWWLYTASKLTGNCWSVIIRHPQDHQYPEWPLWLSSRAVCRRLLSRITKDLEAQGSKYEIGEPFP